MLVYGGRFKLNQILTGQVGVPSIIFGLYDTKIPIGPNVQIADIPESTFTGYARQITSSWVIELTPDGAGNFISDSALITFTNTGLSDATVWGFFVVFSSGPELMALSEYFPPLVIPAGQSQTFQPKFFTNTL